MARAGSDLYACRVCLDVLTTSDKAVECAIRDNLTSGRRPEIDDLYPIRIVVEFVRPTK